MSVNIPGIELTSTEFRQNAPIGISALGTPIYDDITFPEGIYIDIDGNEISYPRLSLHSFQMTIKQEKIISETVVGFRKGTIKMDFAEGDYIISITGKITELLNFMPYDQLTIWKSITQNPQNLQIISKTLNDIFEVFTVKLYSFEVSTIPGSMNEVDISFELKSDEPFNIEDFLL